MARRVHLGLGAAFLLAGCEADPKPVEPACSEPAEAPAPTCEPLARAEPPDLSGETKLATAVYHFNIQYVAGGLKGFGQPGDDFDLTEAEVEDRIIEQGLEPVLDFHLDHPAWGADIELQALMVEIIAERHPAVLDKMRQLAARRQVDFDSFHYSDQLYTAYGRRDMEVSLDLTQRVFDRHCLPRGDSIFTQEGQFAAGQIPLADERGYAVSILPKNLFKWQFGDERHREGVLFRRPDVPGHTVLVGGVGWSAPDGAVELTSTFMDDGEIAFTELKLPPYAGKAYKVDPTRIAERVERLEQLEAEGWRHVTVAQAVAALLDRGVEPQPLPAVFDGTWQPKDTGNLYRWMGEDGLYRSIERDGGLLARLWSVRAAVLAAEAVPGCAGSPELDEAWRELLLAQVSDSTGWNPWEGEVRYSFDHADAALLAAQAVGAADPGPDAPECADGDGAGAAADVGAEIYAPAREVRTSVTVCEGKPAAKLLTVSFDAVGGDSPHESVAEAREREIEVRFARTGDDVALVQAMEDRMVRSTLADYAFETSGQPLAIGLVGLGASGGAGQDRWVVQDHRAGRTAALISTRGDHQGWIRFSDRTVGRSVAGALRFYLLEGASDEDAIAFARRINGP